MCCQEALRDLSEEQEELRTEVEHDLREEVDMSLNQVRQVSTPSKTFIHSVPLKGSAPPPPLTLLPFPLLCAYTGPRPLPV